MVKEESSAAAFAARPLSRPDVHRLRPSEAMRYRPERWNRDTQPLVIYSGRVGAGGRFRSARRTAEALADLEAVRAIGRFLHLHRPNALFSGPQPRSGFCGVRPYDLRHSYGTALYRVDDDTRLPKDVLDYSDTGMTERRHAAQDVSTDPRFRAAPRPTANKVDMIDGHPRRAAKAGFRAPPPVTRSHLTPILEP